MAIRYGGNEKERYASSIVTVLKHINRETPWVFAGTGFIERRNYLTGRIRRIVHDSYRNWTGLSASNIIVLITAGLIGIVVACSKEAPEKITDPVILSALHGDSIVKTGEGRLTYTFVRVDSASER